MGHHYKLSFAHIASRLEFVYSTNSPLYFRLPTFCCDPQIFYGILLIYHFFDFVIDHLTRYKTCQSQQRPEHAGGLPRPLFFRPTIGRNPQSSNATYSCSGGCIFRQPLSSSSSPSDIHSPVVSPFTSVLGATSQTLSSRALSIVSMNVVCIVPQV